MAKTDDVPSGENQDLPPKALSEIARRALREAEERRAAIDRAADVPTEKGGRGGLEPGRYGDWEIKGLTSDF